VVVFEQSHGLVYGQLIKENEENGGACFNKREGKTNERSKEEVTIFW
jgi:hypothetical protein